MSTRKPAREPSVLGAITAGSTLGVANVAVAAVAAVGVVGVAAVAGGVVGIAALTAVVVKARKKARKDKTVAGSAKKAGKSSKAGSGKGKGLLGRGASVAKAAKAAGGRKGSGLGATSKAGKGKSGKGTLGGLGKSAKGATRAGKRAGGPGSGKSKGKSGSGLFGSKGSKAKSAKAAKTGKAKAAKKAEKAAKVGKGSKKSSDSLGSKAKNGSKASTPEGRIKKAARKAAHKAAAWPWMKYWADRSKARKLKKASAPARKKMPKAPMSYQAVRPQPKVNVSRPSDVSKKQQKGMEVAVAAKVSGLPNPFRGTVETMNREVGAWKCPEGRNVLAMFEGFEEVYKGWREALRRAKGTAAQRFPNDSALQEFLTGLEVGAARYAAYTEQGRLAYLGMNKDKIDYMTGSTDQWDQSRNMI